MYLQIFNARDYILFTISASGIFLKCFFKFRKFQPGYSHKIYSYRKERVYVICTFPEDMVHASLPQDDKRVNLWNILKVG